jgi:hypothetical protein
MPGLADPDEIDLIAEDTDGSALLSIVQTGPWAANRSELDSLKRKLANYLRFALEGQMVAKYPILQGRAVVVELTHDEPLPQAVVDYWAKAAKRALRDGARLSTRRLGDSFWTSAVV